MATKPNYVKAGYEDSLQFDPASGIIKYGNYEFFADQVGVKPKVERVTFDGYKQGLIQAGKSYDGNIAAAALYPTAMPSDDVLRQQFDAMMTERASGQAGAEVTGGTPQASAVQLLGGAESGNNITDAQSRIPKTIAPTFNRVNRIDNDTYEVQSYEIPSDIDFVNRLNKRAASLNANAEQGQVTDASRPAGTGRLGKPNYSRASTILAGEQSPLGGAATTLGS